MLELMRLPRSPSLPSATELGGPGGNRTLIPWVRATDPPVEQRPHSGVTLRIRTASVREQKSVGFGATNATLNPSYSSLTTKRPP